MKIGELAGRARCSVETVRYYEKERLLPKSERDANNYRAYGQAHLHRLLFIRNCRAFDMSHEEIRGLIGLMEKAPENCDSVNDVVDKHIAHVETRIQELNGLKEQLSDLRQKCQSSSTIDDCRILHRLSTMDTGHKRARATHV